MSTAGVVASSLGAREKALAEMVEQQEALGIVGVNLVYGAAILGSVLQPSEILHDKAVLVEPGSFRPVTRVHLDIIRCARERFRADLGGEEPIGLAEITMRNLLAEGELDLRDFLDRSDALAAMGYTVVISDYFKYWKLAAYLAHHTQRPIPSKRGRA